MNIKKIVYMGTPNYAKMILQTLIDAKDMEVSLVLTQPDRPVGRKKLLTPPVVKLLAQEHNIELLQPQRLSEDGIYNAIVDAKPDFIVVAAFGQILPQSILDIAPCINLHASLLPQYRGASPVQQSLLNGDNYSGVTSMLMEAGLDSGPIWGYSFVKIPETMRLQQLMLQLSEDACLLTLDTIRNFESLEPMPQTKATSTHCKKISKQDGQIEFKDANELFNKYRAFEGWPGIFTANGLKIIEMNIVECDSTNISGEILSIGSKNITIACSRGSIEIKKLQPISKKPMDAKAYLLGKGLKIGDLLI